MDEEQAKKQTALSNPSRAGALSLFQLIRQDYIALLGLVVPPIIWAIFSYLAFNKGEGLSNNLILIGVMVTLVNLGLLVWRVIFFHSLFSDAQEAQGIISGIIYYRDRRLVNFTFTYNGQKYISGSAVMKTKRTASLKIGEAVLLLVDRNDPRKAIIRKLYSREG